MSEWLQLHCQFSKRAPRLQLFTKKIASSFFHVTLLVPPPFFSPTVFFWEIVVSDGVCKRHAHKFQIPTVGKIRRFSHDSLTFPHLFPIEYR